MTELDIFKEADRQLTICNACRYCEGLCPVFPALELRRTFTEDDIRYLGNLCHDCRACQQACMYTDPHEFAMNFPKAMSEVRMESYEHWSWPRFLGRLFSDTPKGALLGSAAAVIVFLLAALLISSDRLFAIHRGPGAFYQVAPYPAMVLPALVLFFYGAAIWLQGSVRFWSESDSALLRQPHGLAPLFRALRDSLTVKYLGGGGSGCWYPGDAPSDAPSSVRRVFHSLVFWGFLSDLLSTTLAFAYQDFLRILPPYSLTSAPVIFGIAGGVGLIIGTVGLLWFKLNSNRMLSAQAAYGLDYAFLIFLGLTGLTGMLTLILRSTSAMGTILVIHLGMVAALFITAPYGKFVHFVYRFLALVRYQIEVQAFEAQRSQRQAGH
jgi:citrate/tricarballylate utilization protein